MSEVIGHAVNPAPEILAAFSDIATTRMAELPINNPALRVDVVGFRAWEGQWLGVLVTPWTISLMIVPGEGGGFRRLGADQRQEWRFPAGRFEFMGAEDERFGPYQTCSLFSPVFEFSDHDSACHAAVAALETLFTPEAPDADADSPEPSGPRPISRRDLLRGRFSGSR